MTTSTANSTGTATQVDAVQARIRDVEEAIEKLVVRLKPDTPHAQRVPLERMIAKKQATLRGLHKRLPAQRSSA